MDPHFSIIIPLYNKENHIKDTLHSVWSQSFKDFEVIVVNDGSTDNSLQLLETVNDKRLRIFSTHNQGVSSARNYGISMARAKFIVFLDADDLWLAHHLQDLKNLYEQFPNCGMYSKAYYKIDGTTTIAQQFKNIPGKKLWEGIVEDYFYSSQISSIAWTSAVMVPMSILDKVGVFNPEITLGAGEDTDLWIRIALQHPVAFSNSVSAMHQLHSDNRVSKASIHLKQFIDLNRYNNDTANHASLKRYLDLNRYATAIQYKLAGNSEEATILIRELDKSSLNKKQRFLLTQPQFTLKILLKVKEFLKKLGFQFSSFR
jgi:glycosyltransferase involved in cell wall biosynthesis